MRCTQYTTCRRLLSYVVFFFVDGGEPYLGNESYQMGIPNFLTEVPVKTSAQMPKARHAHHRENILTGITTTGAQRTLFCCFPSSQL